MLVPFERRMTKYASLFTARHIAKGLMGPLQTNLKIESHILDSRFCVLAAL
jgi:hypothetical protein